MKVQSLFIYPVKSLAGIGVQAFEMDDFGAAQDRRWMIVDAERNFVSQRTHPELARIHTRIENGTVFIDIPGEGSFYLEPGDEEVRVLVWRDWVKALYGKPAPSAALSRYLGQPLHFVYMPDDTFRRVDASRVSDYRRVSFADGFPFLVVNLASLEELNGRLEEPVDIRRFRPNIVVEGAEPWVEDHWHNLVIGSTRFELVKPCSRCIMTTVDPDNGVQAPNLQPLRTLGKYRRTPDGVIFGMNAIHEAPGTIRVGDSVTLSETE
ncbi:MAG TPA: MOSC N-terminal beta barrel domain-containing protein [Marinobacter sp.]